MSSRGASKEGREERVVVTERRGERSGDREERGVEIERREEGGNRETIDATVVIPLFVYLFGAFLYLHIQNSSNHNIYITQYNRMEH